MRAGVSASVALAWALTLAANIALAAPAQAAPASAPAVTCNPNVQALNYNGLPTPATFDKGKLTGLDGKIYVMSWGTTCHIEGVRPDFFPKGSDFDEYALKNVVFARVYGVDHDRVAPSVIEADGTVVTQYKVRFDTDPSERVHFWINALVTIQRNDAANDWKISSESLSIEPISGVGAKYLLKTGYSIEIKRAGEGAAGVGAGAGAGATAGASVADAFNVTFTNYSLIQEPNPFAFKIAKAVTGGPDEAKREVLFRSSLAMDNIFGLPLPEPQATSTAATKAQQVP